MSGDAKTLRLRAPGEMSYISSLNFPSKELIHSKSKPNQRQNQYKTQISITTKRIQWLQPISLSPSNLLLHPTIHSSQTQTKWLHPILPNTPRLYPKAPLSKSTSRGRSGRASSPTSTILQTPYTLSIIPHSVSQPTWFSKRPPRRKSSELES